MRFLQTALLAGGAMAAAVVRPDDWDCILSNRREMATDASCGEHHLLTQCFFEIDDSSAPVLADCYIQAGCSDEEASAVALEAANRCNDLFGGMELKRRSRGELDARMPEPTAAPTLAAMAFWERDIFFPRTADTGTACYATSQKATTRCDVETSDGSVNTKTCRSVDEDVSECLPQKTCSMDRQGDTVCMDLVNSLDVAGIIVTVIFGVSIVLGIATVTYLCCKDRKEQKRLAAKAEATALVRAATKKKRDAEARAQRAPLIQQHQDRQQNASPGPGDPFHDNNRS